VATSLCVDIGVVESLRRETKKVRDAMKTQTTQRSEWLILDVKTAEALMTRGPLSIRADATVREAVAFLTDKGFSAAPVIDKAGRPVGVLSRADILVHDREVVEYLKPTPEYYERGTLVAPGGESLQDGFQVEKADTAQVRDIMTPVVFAVKPETAAHKVVEDMLALKIHHLFVVDNDGVLVGIISTLDILKHLHPERPGTSTSVPAVRGPAKRSARQAKRAEKLVTETS
jgi:CBS domain-containing protein